MDLFENLQIYKESKTPKMRRNLREATADDQLQELIDAARNEANDIDYDNAAEDINMCKDELEAMADRDNDPYVDAVIEKIITEYDFSEDYIQEHTDEIIDTLVSYSRRTLNNFEWIFSSYIEQQEDAYYDEEEEDHEEEEEEEDYEEEKPEIIENFTWDGKADVPEGVVNVKIEDGVKKIESAAFMDCHSLESIKIPNSVTSIEMMAFNHCKSLKDVYYGGSEEDWNKIATSIGNIELLNANIHFAK